MNKIRILVLCLITTMGYAQKKMSKTSQSIKVSKDVVVELNTSYVEIEIDTWNKDVVEVEAYIEGQKLSEDELKQALDVWNLNVIGSYDKVIISSEGGRSVGLLNIGDYTTVLQNLEFNLADLPEMPTMPELPIMSGMPQLPAMPIMPELPELPKGVTTIDFDYDRYQEEGETYLTEWSKKYEKKGGKEFQKRMEEWARKFADSGYQEKMEKWGKEYGKRFDGKWAKDMEKWGEDLGEKFGEDWSKKMEDWGERFSKEMESKAKVIEYRAEAMEKRVEALAERKEERNDMLLEKREERRQALEEREALLQNRKESRLSSYLESNGNTKVRKVIKIKIPKKAKLKMNVRHGELKIVSALHNAKGDISHSFLVAEHINGSETSINVSYSPVVINTWDVGTLNLNFVDKAQIKTAKNLVLNSKSSNINIENLTDTGIIDGSFGDLTISNLPESFKNLNLVLENSDALINLPKNIDYTLYFKGNRSKYNNKVTTQKTIRNYPEGQSSNRNIMVNAKFSNVIIN